MMQQYMFHVTPSCCTGTENWQPLSNIEAAATRWNLSGIAVEIVEF